MSSDSLFVMPSFFSGAARVLDLWGWLDRYDRSRTPEEADLRARLSDWLATQQDSREALRLLLEHDPELTRDLLRILGPEPAGNFQDKEPFE